MSEYVFLIHFTLPSGVPDSVVVSGDSLEYCREEAQAAVRMRNGADPWSEQISGSDPGPDAA